jgi:hypothetical protein
MFGGDVQMKKASLGFLVAILLLAALVPAVSAAGASSGINAPNDLFSWEGN